VDSNSQVSHVYILVSGGSIGLFRIEKELIITITTSMFDRKLQAQAKAQLKRIRQITGVEPIKKKSSSKKSSKTPWNAKPIDLGVVCFPTKTAAVAAIQQILRTNVNRELNGKDFEIVRALLDRHPRAEEKIGCGVKAIIVKKTENQRGVNISNCRCFYVQRLDGSFIDFSYDVCINPERDNPDYNRIKAYRSAVDKQILKFKESNNLICALCGSSRDPEADHIVPFVTLVNQFEETVTSVPMEFSDDPVYHFCVFRKEDKDFAAKWKRYHKKHAQLRILCKRCNCSRSTPPKYVSRFTGNPTSNDLAKVIN